VSESHRACLIPKLEADGVNVAAAIEQGRYILLDAADVLSRLTVNDIPDPARCTEVVGDLIMGAAKGIRLPPFRTLKVFRSAVVSIYLVAGLPNNSQRDENRGVCWSCTQES
jgi:hypothetical protein